MKKILLLSVILSLLISCSGRKQVEKALNSGNYDQAINDALKKLETNKDKKRKQDYAFMLQDAYYKVVERDLNDISHLKKDNNPELYQNIYEIYSDLNARQEAIKPILPLNINGKNLRFKFNDYSNDIVEWREKASDYLYEKGLKLLDSEHKNNIREAYSTYEYIESINPNYADTRDLMEEAYQKGLDYVIVSIENRTHQIIPRRLEEDLLNFDTYGLNKFWTAYHSNMDGNINYDYSMQLQLKQINISPEQINEREFLRKRDIVDGWEYQLDGNGNVAKDSLGNDIKIDKIVEVRARFFEVVQIKSSQIIADVVYADLKTNQLIKTFPIDSGFVFENVFGSYRGDKRALTREDIDLTRNYRVPFPSNEQMVYDTGEDLKLKLKNIIHRFNF
ncbi:hypothetical protein RXV94_12030 [Yeosuana sp. MJ-SS3]|uniref:Lipoprotein n=1 Tax=Gilvirhabdus luticola TaxID=3079858 RepID=A0ABU3U904_9FLAO|nr:hypothetical protein [Yeosuana sp. MJ-SS3]MDU8886892.1 hypothetical protein [Yeosuana sp. MJ-SS3]